MTGRRGYALRGSDAMTGAHQRGRYAGRDSGQERLVGKPAHSNKFIMRGLCPRSKETKENHYDIEQERKEDFVCFRLPQPQ